MDGISIIEGKELNWIRQQLVALQQQNLAIMKQLQNLMPAPSSSSVPDFISIGDASKKYHVSRVTINNKVRLFEETKGRPIDRLRAGIYNLINEIELQEALRLKPSENAPFIKKVSK